MSSLRGQTLKKKLFFAFLKHFMTEIDGKKLFKHQQIYFDQQTAYGAPISWSKYTTSTAVHETDLKQVLF